MDFNTLSVAHDGKIENKYAGRLDDGTWLTGTIDTNFLNDNFGQFTTATEMKNATTSEGLKLFFDWLAEQGEIPA